MELSLMLTILGLLTTASHSSPSGECTVEISKLSKNTEAGKSLQPLLLQKDSFEEWKYAKKVFLNNKWQIVFKAGESVKIVCGPRDKGYSREIPCGNSPTAPKEFETILQLPCESPVEIKEKQTEEECGLNKEGVIWEHGYEVERVMMTVFKKCQDKEGGFYLFRSYGPHDKMLEKTGDSGDAHHEENLSSYLEVIFQDQEILRSFLVESTPRGEALELLPQGDMAFATQRQVNSHPFWQWTSIFYENWLQNEKHILEAFSDEMGAEYYIYTGVIGSYGNMPGESVWAKEQWRLAVRIRGFEILCTGFILRNTPKWMKGVEENLCGIVCEDYGWMKPVFEYYKGRIECCSYSDMKKVVKIEPLPLINCKGIMSKKNAE